MGKDRNKPRKEIKKKSKSQKAKDFNNRKAQPILQPGVV